MRELFFVVLVLACPFAMFLMMRSGHGHGGHDHTSAAGNPQPRLSSAELRRRRRELDRLIEERDDGLQVEETTRGLTDRRRRSPSTSRSR